MKQKHTDKISDQEFLEQYEKTPHIGKLSTAFGLPNITIWRRAQKLGLSFSSIGAGVKIELDEILNGLHPHYQTLKLKKRLIKEGIFENQCAECGIIEWNGKPISMQLDHVNGDSSDHRLQNLRMLCPNCHSQTDTYCGKNKGNSGRDGELRQTDIEFS